VKIFNKNKMLKINQVEPGETLSLLCLGFGPMRSRQQFQHIPYIQPVASTCLVTQATATTNILPPHFYRALLMNNDTYDASAHLKI